MGGGGGGDSSGLGGINPAMMHSLAQATGFGAYGEKLYGKGQSFVSRYLPGKSTMFPFLNVNNQYVMDKLKMLLCPYLYKQDWQRQTKQVAGGRTYQPPRFDPHAPDLYLPIMGFFAYTLLSCLFMVSEEKFEPQALRSQVWVGLAGWGVALLVLWVGHKSLGTSQVSIKVPMLDLVAYSGYTFVYVALELVALLISKYAFYTTWLWCSVAGAVFVVKTTKETIREHYRANKLRGESIGGEWQMTPEHFDSSSLHKYVLLCMAMAQLPVSYWLCWL